MVGRVGQRSIRDSGLSYRTDSMRVEDVRDSVAESEQSSMQPGTG